jgi:transcriptional regulator with XRE-family HTH domain
METDYSKLSREFVRALRGRRSQAALSKRLGYRTNAVYAWESGRNLPTAADALRLAARCGIDVRAALSDFYRRTPAWFAAIEPVSAEGVAALLDDLRGRTSVVELSRAAKRSRFAVARWLSGTAEPKLPEFLLLLDKSSLRLLEFVAAFTDPSRLPSVAEAWQQHEAARRAAYDVPWTQAVLRALELSEYTELERHQQGWIARRIGISPQEEQRCIDLLTQTGQVYADEQGRLCLREVMALDTRRNPAAEIDIKRWWTELALSRLGGGANGIFSYNVFAVSHADLLRIQDLYRAYFRQVRSIIAESQPSERVVLATLQLLPLDAAAIPDPSEPDAR